MDARRAWFLRLCEGVFLLTLLFSGGFYEYSAMMTGGLLCAVLLYLFVTKQDRYRGESGFGNKRFQMIVPVCLILYALPVTVFAVDRPMHFAGFLKWSALLPWLYLVRQMTAEEKDRFLLLIPYSGAGMTGVSLLSLVNEQTAALFWRAERLGGTFQYANACALFLATGILVLLHRISGGQRGEGVPARPVQAGLMLFLLAGMLLTGSRGVMLLLAVFVVYKAVRQPAMRKPVFILLAAASASAVIAAAVTGNVQNIGRVTTLFSHSSTLWGRILYMKDALRMMLRFPFGAGFSGYYYIQPSLQNGVYTTRYVHNDLLQAGIDLGILPMLVLVCYAAWQIIKGHRGTEQKELLCFLFAASLFDLHFQYLFIAMTAVLLLDLGGEHGMSSPGQAQTGAWDQKRSSGAAGRTGSTRGNRYENIVCSIAAMLAFLYFFVPFTAFRLHDDVRTLQLYPHYTESELRMLDAAQNPDTAERIARDILKHNRYLAAPYRHLGYTALMRGEVRSAMDHMDRVIMINRYRVEEYEAYDELLEQMPAIIGVVPGDSAEKEALRKRVADTKASLPNILKDLEESTDPIAYHLRDLPVFEMGDP